ncbi:MAG TPA: hydrogen gas-evolving membrane-bound hydrogenase subunit E [Desulfobacterales bacterium]|nr:hydrogen gas-evolving membrane-bound hydrogenase subunit E [Desulfobacterales bacterium]
MRRAARAVVAGLILAAVAVVLATALLPIAYHHPDEAREAVEELRGRAPSETGAVNLVSAIYLGYRAFDTLGETVALLLAVAGIAFLLTEAK